MSSDSSSEKETEKGPPRKQYTISDKLEFIRMVEEAGDDGVQKVSAAKKINPNTLYHWMQKKEKIIKASRETATATKLKHAKFSEHEDVDQDLWEWFLEMKSRTYPPPLDSTALLTQANKFALKYCEKREEFQPLSSYFIHLFRKRHKISLATPQREAASAPQNLMKEWLSVDLPKLLQDYPLEDIYNGDELGLQYSLICAKKVAVLEGKRPVGTKQSKERVTVLLCASATGEKLPPVVIGRSKNPKVLPADHSTLGVIYLSSKKAWMTATLFTIFLQQMEEVGRKKQRKVLLLCDNCSAHRVPDFQSS
jgi:transposase-like protein